jgi:hypothetical protein
MEEFVLVAVSSGGELHWKLWGEVHRNHGWLGVAMEWGHLKWLGLERGWNTGGLSETLLLERDRNLLRLVL